MACRINYCRPPNIAPNRPHPISRWDAHPTLYPSSYRRPREFVPGGDLVRVSRGGDGHARFLMGVLLPLTTGFHDVHGYPACV